MKLIILMLLISLSSAVFADNCYRDNQDVVCSETSKDGTVTTSRYYEPIDNSSDMKNTSHQENTVPHEEQCRSVHWGVFEEECIKR